MRDLVLNDLIRGVNAHVITDSESAYIQDPVFHIIRNRVHAEFSKTLMRVDKYPYAFKFLNTLLKSQNNNGSWNEIHPNYTEPSALITSIIGEALLMALAYDPDNQWFRESVDQAKEYVITCEIEPGYYLKSKKYTADHLNVDATCGAFLAQYGKLYSDTKTTEAAKYAARRVCKYQQNGYFPYTADKGNYPYFFNIPCIHYQGVTLYYLSKIQEIIDEPWLEKSLQSGTEWLASVQQRDGTFDWSKSGLMFAYYLTGSYGFAYAVFHSQSRENAEYSENASRCLDILEKNISSIALRWETASWASLFLPGLMTLKSAFLGDFPLSHRLFRLGYGSYRQIARRRIHSKVHERTFNALCRILCISSSTVEPMNNFPDLFMTAEILDCLSSTKVAEKYAV